MSRMDDIHNMVAEQVDPETTNYVYERDHRLSISDVESMALREARLRESRNDDTFIGLLTEVLHGKR